MLFTTGVHWLFAVICVAGTNVGVEVLVTVTVGVQVKVGV